MPPPGKAQGNDGQPTGARRARRSRRAVAAKLSSGPAEPMQGHGRTRGRTRQRHCQSCPLLFLGPCRCRTSSCQTPWGHSRHSPSPGAGAVQWVVVVVAAAAAASTRTTAPAPMRTKRPLNNPHDKLSPWHCTASLPRPPCSPPPRPLSFPRSWPAHLHPGPQPRRARGRPTPPPPSSWWPSWRLSSHTHMRDFIFQIAARFFLLVLLHAWHGRGRGGAAAAPGGRPRRGRGGRRCRCV